MPNAIVFHPLGVTYNGLHSTTTPTAPQVRDDLTLTKAHFGYVRTYYPQYNGGAVDVGWITYDLGLRVLNSLFLFDGHPDWIENNYVQFLKPALARGNVIGVLIGNEDPDKLATIIQYVQRVKQDFPQTPVSTAQTTGFWLADSRASQILPLVDFIGVNIYPDWDWTKPNANNQPVNAGPSVTPEEGFSSFLATYQQLVSKYSGMQIVVTETGWPTTYGWVVNTNPPMQFDIGITNARDYLNRVKNWAQGAQVNVYIHNMFDDLYGVDTSSQFNLHFGLIDYNGKAKGVFY
jgi:exo-beta-1,3-glucanase (GH17 family)